MTALSEDHILKTLENYFPNTHPSLVLGRGDDCSIVRVQNSICVSTDLFIENVHFRNAYFSPQEVGHKALAVNLSDIAAMGARPLGFSLGLGLPAHTEMSWLEGFFSGMAQLAKNHSLVLSGGDLSKTDTLHICITIWGECVNNKHLGETPLSFLTRGGAMPGDTLFVVGDVGLARIGLEELEKYGTKAKKYWPAACEAHLFPQPLIEAGLIIARSNIQMRSPVLMDISDGLCRDVPRLLGQQGQRGLGAQIVIPTATLHEEVVRHAHEHKRCAVEQAWLGGEDYALLGACVPKLLPILHAALPKLRSIGTLTECGYIELNGERVQSGGGFDHFG